MPWSPVPKFPEIIASLNAKGFTKEVNFNNLRVTIIQVTGLIKDETIKRIIKIMEELGYLQMGVNCWKICQGKPYLFVEDDDKELEKYE